MRTGKKENKIGIKWKIFVYLSVFTAIMLTLLWLCQVVFLDDIYKIIKIGEIKQVARVLIEKADDDDFAAAAEQISRKNEVCVLVTRMLGKNLALQVLSIENSTSCAIHTTTDSSKFKLYDWAQSNGGSELQYFYYDDVTKSFLRTEGGLFDKTADGRGAESIIYTIITENGDGEDIVIYLNSVILPVDATVKTLNILLGLISGILLLLALATALVISGRISAPIRRLTAAAGELAGGNYDVSFDTSGYREIAQLGDALSFAASELSKTDGLRRELIANISHDLRTPLTMITGYSEVMRDIPGENTPENIQTVIDESKRLSSLVNDVLDISKLTSGVQECNITPVNITGELREIIGRYNKLTGQVGFVIELIADGDVTVMTDGVRFSQVLYNLINNALNYTGEDKKVTVRQLVDEKTVRIEVTDSGEGIPEDKLPYIWDRYYKIKSEKATHRRAAVGSGLGLSIVKSTMKLLGGTCGVSSTVGVGSTFFVELKL